MSDYRVFETMRDGVEGGDDRCCGTCGHWAESIRFPRGPRKSDAVAGVCRLKGERFLAGEISLENVVEKEYHLCRHWTPYEEDI